MFYYPDDTVIMVDILEDPETLIRYSGDYGRKRDLRKLVKITQYEQRNLDSRRPADRKSKKLHLPKNIYNRK